LTTAAGTGSPGDANTATRRAPGRPRGAALRYFCPCPRGLEAALAAELVAIGANDVTAVSGGVGCSGPLSIGYRINLHSRIASRALLEVARRPYRREADLLALAREQRWESLFDVERTLRVDTSAIRSPLKSLQFATLTVKDGIVDRFRDRVGTRPSIDTVDPDVRVSLFLTDREATLYLDLSGEPLFKRGWRAGAEHHGEAPLKENLAAGLLALSRWQPTQPLLDPFCGAGTIVIEAAQIATERPPGLARRFAIERLKIHNASQWQALIERAEGRHQDRLAAGTPLIRGSDIDPEVIATARGNFVRAGLPADLVTLDVADARAARPFAAGGLLLANSPYGERLEADPALWREMGAVLRTHFGGWRAAFLWPDRGLPGLLGLREDQRTPLFNGAIECRLFGFGLRDPASRPRARPAGPPAPQPGEPDAATRD
jgi:putative N6-adenine-specific DNA methylase